LSTRYLNCIADGTEDGDEGEQNQETVAHVDVLKGSLKGGEDEHRQNDPHGQDAEPQASAQDGRAVDDLIEAVHGGLELAVRDASAEEERQTFVERRAAEQRLAQLEPHLRRSDAVHDTARCCRSRRRVDELLCLHRESVI
jgi:hypothetical protein